jgi:hypothetical protein
MSWSGDTIKVATGFFTLHFASQEAGSMKRLLFVLLIWGSLNGAQPSDFPAKNRSVSPIKNWPLPGIVYIDGSNYPLTDAGLKNACASFGANGGTVYLSPGHYTIREELLINTPCNFIGTGEAGINFQGPSPNPSTIFSCGVIVGACIHFSSESGSSKRALKGGGLERVSIFGNKQATYCLELSSVSHGVYRNISIFECLSSGLRLDVVSTSADYRDTQGNEFSNISIQEGAYAATAGADDIELTGDSIADSSVNNFSNLWLSHKNGAGISDLNGDNNNFSRLIFTSASGGSGKDIHLGGSGSINTSAREETFIGVAATSAGVTQDDFANGNAMLDYSLCSGAPPPVILSGQMNYSLLDCTGNKTSIFTPKIVAGALVAGGTGPELIGTGACATITKQLGAALGGSFKCTGRTGESAAVIKLPMAAPNGWSCSASDITTGNVLRQTAFSATTCTIGGVVNSDDILTFSAVGF